MRFMILLKADKTTEAGVLPSEKQLAEMGKYNEQLAEAGVLLAGEGLQPSSQGARVRFSGATRSVSLGPFAEAEIEIRRVYEAEDFGAELTAELREAEERLRMQIAETPDTGS